MDNGYFTKVQSQFIAERIAFFFNKLCCSCWTPIQGKANFTPYIKINSKWIMNLNVNIKPQNFQIKNRRKSSWPEVRQRALRLDKKSMVQKENIDTVDFIKV